MALHTHESDLNSHLPARDCIPSRRQVWADWARRRRGSFALVILAPFAVLAILSPPHYHAASLRAFAFDALAWTAFAAGAALRIWATLYIGGRKGSLLTTEGPYSVCRNPLYLGTFLILLSITIYVQSLTFGLGTLLASAVYLTVTVPIEEARLCDHFRSDYDIYCRSVPRFLPDPRKYHSDSIVEVDLRCLKMEFLRAMRWSWVPLVCVFVAILREQSWWHPILNVP